LNGWIKHTSPNCLKRDIAVCGFILQPIGFLFVIGIRRMIPALDKFLKKEAV
jgi:hypothetical protein